MADGRTGTAHRLLATALMRRDEAAPVRTRAAYRPPPPVAAKMRPVVAGLYSGKAPGHAGLLLHWPDIVGPELAAVTEPGKLIPGRGLVNNGQLTVRAAGPVALELQHRETQILERINTFLGYRAAGRLKLVQAPLEHRKVRGQAKMSQIRPPSPAEESRSAELARDVRDDGLRATLCRLGARILAECAQMTEKRNASSCADAAEERRSD